MALEDTIRQMLQEGKKPSAVDKEKVKAELKATQEKIKKLKKDGKDVTKLTTKVKDLRKQLKESFGEEDLDEVQEAEGKASYTADGVNVVDADGEVAHVADSEEEAQEIVARLNDELTEAAGDDEEEKEGEDKEGEEEEAPAGAEDDLGLGDELGDLEGEEEAPAASDDVAGEFGEEEAAAGEEGEMPDDERVTVVVVSPEHEDDEPGEEEEEVKEDTGEADARKTQPSSKEEQEKVFAKHKERLDKLRDEDEVKEGVFDNVKDKFGTAKEKISSFAKNAFSKEGAPALEFVVDKLVDLKNSDPDAFAEIKRTFDKDRITNVASLFQALKNKNLASTAELIRIYPAYGKPFNVHDKEPFSLAQLRNALRAKGIKIFEDSDNEPESKDVIESLLSGETLSEDFKEKTRVIFEAALNEKLEQHKKLVEDRVKAKYSVKLKTIREEYDQKLSKQISIVEDTIVEKIDSFLNYEVDQWVNENKVALVGNLRAELTEEFIDGLKGLFKEHYIDVPDEKFDLIGAQEETIQTLETKLEESVKGYSDLAKENKELKRKMIIAEASQGLTETQKLRFEKLTEKVDFESEKTFQGKLEIIKESFFGKKADKEVLTEEKKEEEKQLSTVDIYAKMLKRG